MALTLLDAVTSNTTGAYFPSDGYQAALIISGGIGGGTVTIETTINEGTTNLPILDASGSAINTFTVSGHYSQFPIPAGVQVRARLTGSTTPTLTVLLV